MKRLSIFMSLLLVIAMCLAALASCSQEDEVSNTPSGETSEDVEFPHSDFYEERTIRILCVETARHNYGTVQFAPDPESKYTAVNEAVKKRNDLIAEKYGLTIEVIPVNRPLSDLQTAMTVNDDLYDIVCDSVDNMLPSVTEHYFWSLDDMMDFSYPWWDQSAIDSISIAGKHYFLCGDALITDDDNTYMYLFNKNMYNDNVDLAGKYGNIYDMVDEGRFTLDNFTEMCKMVSHVDENGEWGFKATYGNLSHAYGATVMMNGCNIATASPDPATGYFMLNVGTSAAISAFDKVYKIMSDRSLTQRAELIIGNGSNPSKYGFAELEEMFVSGRGLFYNTTSGSISILKSRAEGLDFEFGVLPIPKLNESQENYYNTVNRYQSSVIGIPVTNTGAQREATFVLLQALGYYSEEVKTAYYETTLKLQALKGSDDERMLDLVFTNRFYDLGSMFGWGNNALINFYGAVIANDATNSVQASWESIQSAVETDMKATIDAYENSPT